jgi:hypothetical protein
MSIQLHSFINKSEIKLKNGDCLKSGRLFNMWWEEVDGHARPRVIDSLTGTEYKISSPAAIRMLGRKSPSEATLKKWDREGFSKSVIGEIVDPDGYDQYGSPSWLLVYGLI